MSEPQPPPGLDPQVRHREVYVEATTEHLEKMLHEAHVREFTFHSDEPASLGGENAHPYPLDYFTAAVAL